jgi:hypothetical protein
LLVGRAAREQLRLHLDDAGEVTDIDVAPRVEADLDVTFARGTDIGLFSAVDCFANERWE